MYIYMCFKLHICYFHSINLLWNQVYHNKLHNVIWHHICLAFFPPNLKTAFYRLQLLCSSTHLYMQHHIQLLHRCYSRNLPRSQYPTMILLLDGFSRLKNQFIQNKTSTWSPYPPSKMCTRKMANMSNLNKTYFIVFSNDQSISPRMQTYLYINSFNKIWLQQTLINL